MTIRFAPFLRGSQEHVGPKRAIRDKDDESRTLIDPTSQHPTQEHQQINRSAPRQGVDVDRSRHILRRRLVPAKTKAHHDQIRVVNALPTLTSVWIKTFTALQSSRPFDTTSVWDKKTFYRTPSSHPTKTGTRPCVSQYEPVEINLTAKAATEARQSTQQERYTWCFTHNRKLINASKHDSGHTLLANRLLDEKPGESCSFRKTPPRCQTSRRVQIGYARRKTEQFSDLKMRITQYASEKFGQQPPTLFCDLKNAAAATTATTMS